MAADLVPMPSVHVTGKCAVVRVIQAPSFFSPLRHRGPHIAQTGLSTLVLLSVQGLRIWLLVSYLAQTLPTGCPGCVVLLESWEALKKAVVSSKKTRATKVCLETEQQADHRFSGAVYGLAGT